jgi:carbon-monoxide dehydrogenase medium subunit
MMYYRSRQEREGGHVIPAAFDYKAPASLDEAVRLLQEYGPDAKLISGGQSLIPMMRFRMLQPRLLIDIGRIPGLDYLIEENAYLRIGALVTHGMMERSALVEERYPLLAATAEEVADPIVRRRGTVVGSIVHADPAADWPAAMMAARAEVVILGPKGRRVVTIDDFLVDTFTTVLDEAEIAIEVRVPAPGPRSGGHYLKIERKVGDFATAAVGVQVRLDANGRCENAGIGLCAVGPITLRAAAAEASLVGEELTEPVIAQAAQLAAAASQPTADTRGPAEYKQDMIRVLTARALRQAAAQAAAH